MASKNYTVDQIKQLYSILPSRVNEHLKKGDKIYTDDQSIGPLKIILGACDIIYLLKTTDVAGLNVHEVTVS